MSLNDNNQPLALPLRLLGRGKVREIYEVDEARLLLVASDRISAFDVVMTQSIPHKGAVLTQISAWWFAQLGAITPHHLISADIDEIIAALPGLASHRSALAGRTMLCKRTKVFPIECVIRGYLSGSAWAEYQKHGTLAGEVLAPGMVESARLKPELFSPATKAETGHDENITPARMAEIIGAADAKALENRARAIYAHGVDTAGRRGIIIADTKFEFGRDATGNILLIDEVMTPDSSRFWPVADYAPGRAQQSFDKQPVRDYLAEQRTRGLWNGEAPAPPLPPHVVDATSTRYLELFEMMTGKPLDLSA